MKTNHPEISKAESEAIAEAYETVKANKGDDKMKNLLEQLYDQAANAEANLAYSKERLRQAVVTRNHVAEESWQRIYNEHLTRITELRQDLW